MDELEPIQKELINLLQCGLEIVDEPYMSIAKKAGISEAEVLRITGELKEKGVIRRICGSINYRAMGRESVLVTAHVGKDELDSAATMINAIEGVSHNYLREHHFNLWFTLQGRSQDEIRSVLDEPSKTCGIEFHMLPAEKVFKLDVRFDAFSGGKSLLPCKAHFKPAPVQAVKLKENEVAVLKTVQQDLPLTSRPFDVLGFGGLEIIKDLSVRGVVKYVAATVDYRSLGFEANAMLVCSVDAAEIEKAGRELAKSNNVSHCYDRKIFAGWPYNLFGMTHGPDMEYLKRKADEFASANNIKDYRLLETVRELKKKPVAI